MHRKKRLIRKILLFTFPSYPLLAEWADLLGEEPAGNEHIKEKTNFYFLSLKKLWRALIYAIKNYTLHHIAWSLLGATKGRPGCSG